MDSHTATETLRRRIEETLRPLLASTERVALIDFPNYPNVGDSAIYLGELACLASLDVPLPRFICDIATYDRAELARRVGPDGVILLAGGGNFGDLWPITQRLREDVIQSFPDNPIIQLPQTIHFERRDSLCRARAILNAHPNLTVLVRDRRSLEIAGTEFRARSLLCPDIAFALGRLARPIAARRPRLWLLRTDKERRVNELPMSDEAPVDWLEEPATLLRELSYRLMGARLRKHLRRSSRWLLTRVYAPLARQRLRRGLEMLASAEVVITDRLHGHILCLLLGIPHVILDNNYGKLSSFYQTWTADVDDVRWADSSADALIQARDLAARGATPSGTPVSMHKDGGAVERITYLIANHNLASYIGDCLESLRQQTDPNWVALVADDASTDNSLHAVAPFLDDRIRIIVNERNIGYIATLKRLIAEASTDIVAILDADDAISPDATERLRKAYAADPRAEFVYSRFAAYDATLEIMRGVHGAGIPNGSTALRDDCVGHVRSFRRRAYDRTAGLDETMLYAEDRDLLYKLEEVTRPVFVDAILYRYRQLPGSQSRDPTKHEIGARNTRRARRTALRRRRISGLPKLCYEWFFWADYIAYSHRPPPAVRRLARWLARVAYHLAPAFDPRATVEQMRGPAC